LALELSGWWLDHGGRVALMAFVAWQFARASLVSLPALALAAVCALLVFCYRVNSAWVIVGAAVAGVLFSIFH